MKRILTPLTFISAIFLVGCPLNFDKGTIKRNSNESETSQTNDIDIDEIEKQMEELKEVSKSQIDKKKLTSKSDSTTDISINISKETHGKIYTAIKASEIEKKQSSNKPPEWLMAHNTLRQLHNTGALAWSDDIAQRAKAYAESCPNQHSDKAGREYGENIAFATGKVMSPIEVVNAWYDEISLYDYTKPSYQKGTGHFTQVIWKESTKVGCGYNSGCKTGKWEEIWVCQYEKAGNNNSGDSFEKNVLPQLAKRAINPNTKLKVKNLSLSKSNIKQNQDVNHPQQQQITDIDSYSEIPVTETIVETINGEEIMQGEGFKISKKIE